MSKARQQLINNKQQKKIQENEVHNCNLNKRTQLERNLASDYTTK